MIISVQNLISRLPLLNDYFSPPITEQGADDPDSKGDNGEPQIPGSNTSTLSTASAYTEKDSNSSVCSEDHSLSEHQIARDVLFSTRENINIVHEVYRQVGVCEILLH